MIGKIIDVEIDGIVYSGEVIKETHDSVFLDTDYGVKRVFKRDLPEVL